MAVLVIDRKDFLKGVSSFDDVADGGYSPSSKGINPFATPGLLKPGPTFNSAVGTPPAGGIFAFSTWHTNIAPGIVRMLGGTGSSNFDGKFYTADDFGTLTLAATDTANDYKAGISDMIRYKSEFYCTSTTDIAKSNYDFSSNDFDYWVTTKGKTALQSGYPHPMVIFADILFIADGRYLHQIDGTTCTSQVLILPEDYVITALELYNGLIYIAAAKFSGLTENVPALDACIFTWDSYSATWIDEFPVQDPIDSMKVFGGTLLVFAQNYMGYWTGSTINVLRQITSRVYKYQISITKDRLLYLQGDSLFCLGNPVMNKPRFFSIPAVCPSGSFMALFCHRPGKAICPNSTTMYSIQDLDGGTGTGRTFYSNKYNLPAFSKISTVIVVSEALTATTDISLSFIDSTNTTRTIGSYTHTLYGGVSYHTFDVGILNIPPTFTYQQLVTFTTNPKGIRAIYVVYEPVEMVTNK